MTALYANENFPREVVNHLKAFGYDVLTTYEAGQSDKRIPDEEVLIYATNLGQAVITLNRWDFVRLHQTNSNYCGIVVCRQEDDTAAQVQRIHLTLLEYERLDKILIRINKPA